MKIWIDITNTPHVNVLLPVIRHLEKKHQIILTARDFSETLPLLEKNNLEAIVLGDHKGKSRIKKVLGLLERMYSLFRFVPEFDVSLSLGGNYSSTVSKLRKKPAIVFSDNDISFKYLAYSYGSYFIFPSCFNSDRVREKYKINQDRIRKFEGFKENIYIADYIPDPEFMSKIPFRDFITIRPENLKAAYVPANSKTIVPELFRKFKDENILFLPRYEEEKEFASGYNNIFIPDEPLPGLDVCYYTKAMLTGAGTFAREAALLGTPAVSFFPGETFLTVDKIMQEKLWEFKSRNIDEIYNYVITAAKRTNQIEESKKVQNEVLGILDDLLLRLNGNKVN